MPLDRMARVIADASDPREALSNLCETIRDHTGSSGVKVFLVRHHDGGRFLEQLHRTEGPEGPRKNAELSHKRGIGDWVVFNDDWLLIERCMPADRTGVDPEPAVSGRHGRVEVLARLEAEYVESAQDDERTMLVAPLHLQGAVVGALAVWRNEDRPYSTETDPPFLTSCDAYVVSACRQVLQRERTEAELHEASTLESMLESTEETPNPYPGVLSALAKQSLTTAAVLLDNDRRLGRSGQFYFLECWSSDEDELAWLRAALAGYRTIADEPHRLVERIGSDVTERLSPGNRNLAVAEVFRVPPGAAFPKAFIVVLRPRPGSTWNTASLHDRIAPSDSFLRYVAILLTHYGDLRASHLLAELGGPAQGELASPTAVLQRAAALLKKATGCDAALVYAASGTDMAVIEALPDAPGIVGQRVTNDSVTMACMRENRSVRILDVDDESDENAKKLNRPQLEKVQAAYGWSGVRSWLCCPVVYRGRTLGAIKILTSNSGPFLTSRDQQVAKAVSNRAAWEIHKLARSHLLADLNKLADGVTRLSGAQLADKLLAGVHAWIHGHVRDQCDVAIFARSAGKRLLITETTQGIGAELGTSLEAESRVRRRVAWSREDSSHPVLRYFEAVPLLLPGADGLDGHLVVASRSPFAEDERALMREASRELALILNGERLRNDWALANGLFRHALLGPVQGLISQAKMLGKTAQAAGVDAQPYVQRIDKEAEVIRLWRKNQKLYTLGRVSLSVRSQPLRPIIDRCADRYRGPMRSRGIELEVRWNVRGQLDVPFDDYAVDLALSNILDNARKYSFFNRPVILGVGLEKSSVDIWVEDHGHAIPDTAGEHIYNMGTRLDFGDPFRIIRGEGLGLALARAMIEGHEGTLTHSCEREGQGATEATTPYRVRFTMHIPTRWRRR